VREIICLFKQLILKRHPLSSIFFSKNIRLEFVPKIVVRDELDGAEI